MAAVEAALLLQDMVYGGRKVGADPIWSTCTRLVLVSLPELARLYEHAKQTQRRRSLADVLPAVIANLQQALIN